jgi:hypothetical protein
MIRRILTSVATASVLGALVISMPTVAGQTTAPKPATGAPKATDYKVPRTPWGDPDIQGSWTTDDVIGVPLQRPANFGDRFNMTDEEFAARAKADDQNRRNNANAIGSFRFDVGTRSFRQTSLISDPPDGRLPAFTPEAERRRAPRDRGTNGDGPFDSAEDFTLYDRCLTRGVLGSILPVIYGNGARIIQSPGVVSISHEMVHDTRFIYTDGRRHVGGRIRQYMGDSRGRWEGNTLVVETTNLTDRTSIGLNGNGLRHSADMKLTERFTRIEPDVITYEVRVEDPKTYVTPFTITMPLTAPPGFQILPYECHEGNYMIANSLSAERVEDKALAEDLRKGVVRPRNPVQTGNIFGPAAGGRGGAAGRQGGPPPAQ